MTNKFKQIEAQALKLSIDERTILAHRLFESLHPPIDPEIEKAWIEECERRFQAYKEGKIEARPAEEVMREARLALQFKKH